MMTDGVVPGEVQFEKELGLPSWFSTVVCVRGFQKPLNWKFLRQTAAQRQLHGED